MNLLVIIEVEPQVNFFSRNFTCITYSARGYTPSDVPNDIIMYSQEEHGKI